MKKLMVSAALIPCLLLPVAAGKNVAAAAERRPADLFEQLNQLATRHNFMLDVRTDLSEVPPRPVGGDALNQLSVLLADYNHVIVRSLHTGVEKVIVLSRKQPLPPAPDEIVLKMQRRGTHHLVRATLVGTNGAEIRSDLIVDTGSTFVVLPSSQIAELGIAPAALSSRQVRTAQGRVTASIGQIPMLRIDHEEIADVDVAFIDDDKLGDNALLGMSVLGRYKLIIDDENSTMTLIRNE